MIDQETKKIKNGLEKKLKIILTRKKKQEREAYPILCQIYRIKGRCYPCEKQGMKIGECNNISPLCLRANGGK
jgi:hypothetical protein